MNRQRTYPSDRKSHKTLAKTLNSEPLTYSPSNEFPPALPAPYPIQEVQI
jgi:hypothetical protein